MFSLDVGVISVLVIACVIFYTFVILLVVESWFIGLVLSCCVFTEVAWITDEVRTADELFVVAREGEISSWCLFPDFSSNVSITLSFLSNWFFKVETWSCSCAINLSKILDVLMFSVCDCIWVRSISDVSKSCFLKEFTFLKEEYFIDTN